jgi:cell filamentation protein
MSRYERSLGVEGQYQPGSGKRVLLNKRGIRSKRLIERQEFDLLLTTQTSYLSRVTDQTVFTAALIKQMHRDWLSTLYEWAGNYRTVEMAKGEFHWPPAIRVAQNMATIEADTLRKYTPCKGKDLIALGGAIAHVQADLLFVHPFREGNGRLTRWGCDLMALQAGLPAVDYNFTGRGAARFRQHYLQCIVAGYGGNYEPLARFVVEGLTRALARRGDFKPRAPSK